MVGLGSWFLETSSTLRLLRRGVVNPCGRDATHAVAEAIGLRLTPALLQVDKCVRTKLIIAWEDGSVAPVGQGRPARQRKDRAPT